MTNTRQLFFDRLSIGLSLLCAIHCIAIPIILIATPSLLATLHLYDHLFHEILLYFVIPISFIAVFLGFKRHHDQQVLVTAGIGISSLITIALLGHDLLGETGEKFSTLFAISVLAYAHWRNYSLSHLDECKH